MKGTTTEYGIMVHCASGMAMVIVLDEEKEKNTYPNTTSPGVRSESS